MTIRRVPRCAGFRACISTPHCSLSFVSCTLKIYGEIISKQQLMTIC